MRNDPKEKQWKRTSTPGLLRRRGGSYYARLSSGGKTRFEPLETDVLEVAKIRFAKRRAEVEANRKAARKAKSGVGTMGDLLMIYRQKLEKRAGISDRTRAILLNTCEYFGKTWPDFDKVNPSEINPTVIQDWKARALNSGTGYIAKGATVPSPRMTGKSGSMFNQAVDVMRHLLDLAVDAGAIPSNKLTGRRGLKAPYHPRKPVLPDAAKLQAIFAEIEAVGGKGVPAAELCRLLAFTGCRRNEAATLRWQDIDFTRGVVRVRGTKTEAAAREVPMIPAGRELLLKILARREARAQVAIDGKPYVDPAASVLIVREAQKSLTRACAKVGVEKLTHHDLRDAFATTCIESGVDVPTVAAWLGHADGGALLMRVYQHHRRPHSVLQAAKVNFGGVA